MAKIEYSPMALEDLKEINEYVMINWGENVAKRILGKIILDIRREAFLLEFLHQETVQLRVVFWWLVEIPRELLP